MKHIYEYLIGGKKTGNKFQTFHTLKRGDVLYVYRCSFDYSKFEEWKLTVTRTDDEFIYCKYDTGEEDSVPVCDEYVIGWEDEDSNGVPTQEYILYSIDRLKTKKDFLNAHHTVEAAKSKHSK